jgi:hypothetical protein
MEPTQKNIMPSVTRLHPKHGFTLDNFSLQSRGRV